MSDKCNRVEEIAKFAEARIFGENHRIGVVILTDRSVKRLVVDDGGISF